MFVPAGLEAVQPFGKCFEMLNGAVGAHLAVVLICCGDGIGGKSEIKLRFFGSRIPRLDFV